MAFTTDATGDAPPAQIVHGERGEISFSTGIAVDAARNMYVPSQFGSVTMYRAGARGNAPALRTISGPDTGLKYPAAIAVNADGTMFVADAGGGTLNYGAITVYAAGATGDAAPIEAIGGSKTGLVEPYGIALDKAGNIYVLDGDVLVYEKGSTGNVPPIRRIEGADTGLNDAGTKGLALDGSGNIYVASYDEDTGVSAISVFAAKANGNVRPIAYISGPDTALAQPEAIAVDAAGNMYVVNGLTGRSRRSNITVYAAGANGDAPPIAQIAGRKTRFFTNYTEVGIAVR